MTNLIDGSDIDKDAFIAAADLVARSGGRHLQFGYLRENVPVHLAEWWAGARYRGARVGVDTYPGPVEAVEALARRLLTGAKCNLCGRLVALTDGVAFAYHNATLVDGTTWNVEQAARVGQCRWRREGQRWRSACEDGPLRARGRQT